MSEKPKRKQVPIPAAMRLRVLRKENRRLRWDLGEQTAFADEYHATITELWNEREKLRKKETIYIGLFAITRLRNGKFWMVVRSGPNAGEAMEITEKKLGAALIKFFAKEF